MMKKILKEIKKYNRIIIHRHSNPDGDAMGSQLGLKNILKKNFPKKEIFVVGDITKRYAFMEDSQMDVIPDSFYEGALAIILDSSSTNMVCDERYKLADKKIKMDHHIFLEKFADLELVDTSYESCCGLITAFAIACKLKINKLAAKSLYTGMVTDSGRFRYDSTSPRTMRLAGFLMETGFDLNEIFAELYADDFDAIKLKASFVLKIQFTKNNVAYIYTTKEEMAELKADTFSISRGMVATMSDIKGVNTWANFTETEKGVLCEIRSKKYNINPIAVKYGGGGHAKASGATVADRETAMQMLDDLNNLEE